MELSNKLIPYIRVLGCNNNGKTMISQIEKNTKVITSLKRFEKENTNKKLARLLEIDKKATDIYTIGYQKKSKAGLDYTNGMIIK